MPEFNSRECKELLVGLLMIQNHIQHVTAQKKLFVSLCRHGLLSTAWGWSWSWFQSFHSAFLLLSCTDMVQAYNASSDVRDQATKNQVLTG